MYQPLGDLKLEFGDGHKTFNKDSYHRQLDLDTAMTFINYSIDDTSYLRQAFASYPHQVTNISAIRVHSHDNDGPYNILFMVPTHSLLLIVSIATLLVDRSILVNFKLQLIPMANLL